MTTRAPRSAALTAAAVLVIALTSCSSEESGRQGGPGVGSGSAAPEPAAAYTGPAARYDYRLISTCGERNGLGTFDVTVRRGEVVHVRPVDTWSRLQLVRKDIPTLDGFVTTAEQARNQGADVVRLTMRDGHASTLAIDWDAEAMDDEFCWKAVGVRT